MHVAKLLTRIVFAALLMLGALPVHAQVIFSEDFGSGTPLGPALPAGTTTYTYNGTTSGVFPDYLLDGEYTIGSNAQQAFTSWANVTDHTTGTGFMMIVNATAGLQDEFYRRQITLTPNTQFELVVSLTNLNSQADKDYCDTNAGGLILPNVKMRITTPGGTQLASIDTGQIPFNASPQWADYSLNFTTPTAGADVVLILSNNAPGGCGNDIALDDIIVRVPVTMAASNDQANVPDSSAGLANVLNVLANDTIAGLPVQTFVLAGTAVPPQLTFNTATGVVGVVAGAPTGTYSFAYQVCETILQYNCAVATVTIAVTNPVPAGIGFCPVGMIAVLQPGFGASAKFYYNSSAPRAAGAIAAAGTFDNGSIHSEVTYYSYIEIDLTGDPDVLVPGNTALTLSLTSAWGNGARGQILVSADGNTFTSLGTLGSGGSLAGSWTSNTLRHDAITLPAQAIRYVRIVQQAGGVRVDGAGFAERCIIASPSAPNIQISKASALSDPLGYALPDAEVIYTILVQNTGSGSPDTDSMLVIDSLPAELTFYNGDFDDAGSLTDDSVYWTNSGSGLNFDFDRDVRFSSASVVPSSFAQCSYDPLPGYDPLVRHICVNPKGVMQGNAGTSAWGVSFRARIK